MKGFQGPHPPQVGLLLFMYDRKSFRLAASPGKK